MKKLKVVKTSFEFDGLCVVAKGTLSYNKTEVDQLWLKFTNIEEVGLPDIDTVNVIEELAKENLLTKYFCPEIFF